MKLPRPGRLARLWRVLPFVAQDIAGTFDVKHARLYVLRGEVGITPRRLCSIPILVTRDDRCVGWFLDEDYEDVDARGGSHSEVGRIALNLHYDGTFSVLSGDYLPEWRGSLERWRSPHPATQPEKRKPRKPT